ncbi:hypothetical protein QQ045_015056 [Rhodiola kirilowii]
MWHKHHGFKEIVKAQWDGQLHTNPLLNFALQLKRLRLFLKSWNQEVFGNIHTKIKQLNIQVSVVEHDIQNQRNSEKARTLDNIKAGLNDLEVSQLDLLQAKANMDWVQQGDRNTSLFHIALKARGMGLFVNLNMGDDTFSSDPDTIGNSASSHFASIFQARILNNCLAKVLDKIISPKQAGFLHGRNIHENIGLTHDLTHELHAERRGGNVIIKLDMAKAYDRVSWSFIISILRNLGFDNRWCDMVFRCISNCSYSILWKCTSYDIRHARKKDILDLTAFFEGSLPVPYLGAPLFRGISKIENFDYLIDRVRDKITGWMRYHLSMVGRAILVNSVLRSMPMHVVACHPVPKTILRRIESLMASFIWNHGDQKRRHRISWDHICRRKYSGGLGIKTLADIQLAFQGKLAWSYISSDSLWAHFNRSKYQVDKDGSLLWKSFNHLIPTFQNQAKWIIGRGNIIAGEWGSSCGLTIPSQWGKDLREFITTQLGGLAIQSVKGLVLRLRRASPKDPKSWLPLGAYCCGLWDIWLYRNCVRHDGIITPMLMSMRKWISHLTRATKPNLHDPLGFQPRRWKPSWQGVTMNFAIAVYDSHCHGCAILRLNSGSFLKAFASSFPRSSNLRKIIYFCRDAAQVLRVNCWSVGHLQSSHMQATILDHGEEDSHHWDVSYLYRQLLASVNGLTSLRVSPSLNNPAIALAYSDYQGIAPP